MGRLHGGLCKPPPTTCALKCHPHKHPGLWHVYKHKAKVLHYFLRGSPQDPRLQLLGPWTAALLRFLLRTLSLTSARLPPKSPSTLPSQTASTTHQLGDQRAGGLSGRWLLARPERLAQGHLSWGQAGWAAGLLCPSSHLVNPQGPPPRMAVLTVLHQPPLLSSPQVFLAKERNSYMMSQCSMQRRNLKHTWCLPTPTLPGMEPPSPKLPQLVLKTINNKRCTRDFSNSILLICFLLEHNASQCMLVSAEHKRAPCAHISAASALPPSHPLGHRRAPGRAPWPIAASQ